MTVSDLIKELKELEAAAGGEMEVAINGHGYAGIAVCQDFSGAHFVNIWADFEEWEVRHD